MSKKQLIIWGRVWSFSVIIQICAEFSRQIYRLPTIFLRYQNGTWLDGPLQLNNQLYQILLSVQMQQITTRVYRLSKAYSYFYANPLTSNDRDFLQRLILTLYNQQSKRFFFCSSLDRIVTL